MQQVLDFDPALIRYSAALRGVVPPAPETPFRYARIGAVDVAEALCLAASNPEGEFEFILPDEAAVSAANARAQLLGGKNCRFTVQATAGDALVDFFCADLGLAYDKAMLGAVQQLAQRRVAPGGMFVCRYAPFPAHSDGLRFMVAEFTPETPALEQGALLQELKLLGTRYFSQHPHAAHLLASAEAQQRPQDFLQAYGAHGVGESVAIAMMAAMGPAQFGFVGDAAVQANYLELMVPPNVQDALYALRGHLLYEVIKDFATARPQRTDIWVKQPAALGGDSAALFGSCYFGLFDTTQPVPLVVTCQGCTQDFSAPLFQSLIKLMGLLPLTIGDFLSHPSGQGYAAQDVVMALHTLVAFGVAVPMRGSFGGFGAVDYQYPRLAGRFNQQLQLEPVQQNILLASPVAGRPLRLSVAEGLVLQAVGRVGLAESADALMPELQRAAAEPALAALLFQGTATPAPDYAEGMIRSICNNQMAGWYTLGVLEAA